MDRLNFYFLDFHFKNKKFENKDFMISLIDFATASFFIASLSITWKLQFQRNPVKINGFLRSKISFILFKRDRIL